MELLKNVNLVDVINGVVHDSIDILIDGNTIVEIGKEIKETELVDQCIDLTGKWAMPGIINMHEHQTYKRLIGPLYGPNGSITGQTAVDLAIRAVRTAVFSLKSGITTVCEMGASDDISSSIRKAINTGVIPGPRMYISDIQCTITGGHAYELSKEVDTPDEMRKVAREIFKKGNDWIKLLCSHEPVEPVHENKEPVLAEMNEELIRVAVEEAHRVGKKVAVHAMGTVELDRVIRVGVDAIHHGAFLTPEQAKMMKKKNIAFVSTFSAYYNTSRVEFERGEQWAKENLVLRPATKSGFINALNAGVLIASGTDSLGDIIDEIIFMNTYGMNKIDCLRTITINGAIILGAEKEIGSIEVGKFADIVILNKDPFADFENIRNIDFVIKDGKTYDIPNLSLQNLNPRWLLESTGKVTPY